MQKYITLGCKKNTSNFAKYFQKLCDIELRVEITFDKFLLELQLDEHMDLLTLQCMF
jgi:hypothetical protein